MIAKMKNYSLVKQYQMLLPRNFIHTFEKAMDKNI